MDTILQIWQEFFTRFGYPGMAGAIAALTTTVLGAAPLLGKLLNTLIALGQQRKLNKDLFPFYTKQEIQRATQYYVETTCQNVAPSKDDEPGRTHAFAGKEKIIPFFLKKAFNQDVKDGQFYIVLADSGMGKTTFLLNLYLRYVDQLVKPKFQIKLLPLGFPGIDKEIDKIKDDEKRCTILLLDAFDEDIQAVHGYKPRLEELIRKTLHFREVVITCRTQFFPSEEEEPKETGVMRFGVEGGSRVFRKLYLSPFDDHDIRTYLTQRFTWFQRQKKRKAHAIVKFSPNLMVRPMLLSYIEDLLKNEQPYKAAYMVYAELIQRWIEREIHKVPPARRDRYTEELFHFSREIAVDMYCQRERRNGALFIPGVEIAAFAEKHAINLDEIEMKSRSLLNRNARGDYKFSHKSVLEYFLAEEAFFNGEFREKLDFDGMSQARVFFQEMVWEKLTLPFLKQNSLHGEYQLSDGKVQDLSKLKGNALPKALHEATSLKITKCDAIEDVLLFTVFPKLTTLILPPTEIITPQTRALRRLLPDLKVCCYVLRSEPLSSPVSEKKAPAVFGITDVPGRPVEYIKNEYEDRGEVVFDHVTGLTWQKSGVGGKTHADALAYIASLNAQRFAGYNDWRLPTIPELMSLLEPQEQENGLFINSLFDKSMSWCRSADKRLSGSAWSVYFGHGGDASWDILYQGDVRGVRS